MVRRRTAHCLEAALTAACILEQHGYPPLLLIFHSADNLDHILYVYRARDGWGSVARSRDPGLHGREPVFRSLRALAMSYYDEYIDFTGRLTAYATFDLRRLKDYDSEVRGAEYVACPPDADRPTRGYQAEGRARASAAVAHRVQEVHGGARQKADLL